MRACVAVVLAVGGALVARPSSAQKAAGPSYPLAPLPVLSISSFQPGVAFSGYLIGRATRRNDSTTIAMNRARVTLQVGPLPYLGVRIQADYSAAQTGRVRADSTVTGFALTDGYVELAPAPAWTRSRPLLAKLGPALLAGQFKTPFSLEYLTPYGLVRTANRSQAVDRLSPRRDIGVLARVGWNPYAALSAAVLNGQGANATSNPDGAELVAGRLTITPLPVLELSGKLANQTTDHLWGYDARLLWRGLTAEGETVFRSRPTGATTTTDAGGGYALVAYRILPWLEPVYKYDRYWDRRTTRSSGRVTVATTGSTWNVVGATVHSVPEWLRLQLNWVRRDERPSPGRSDEWIAQLVAIF